MQECRFLRGLIPACDRARVDSDLKNLKSVLDKIAKTRVLALAEKAIIVQEINKILFTDFVKND